MKIHICSDLHCEFKWHFIPPLEDEKNIVVILAGDIGLAKKPTTYFETIKDTCSRFRHVIMVLGNHEHYKGNFPTSYSKILAETAEFENFDIMEKETVVIDDVAFVCATLWTDMDKNNPMTMMNAKAVMNDYECVRTGPEHEPWLKKLEPLDTMADHMRAKEYLFPAINFHKSEGRKVVVVTHHLPSFLSIPERYKSSNLNGAYASELGEEIIMELKPELWVHGHIHDSFDYMLGDTRIICNPRGYWDEQLNQDFNDKLVVDV